MGQNMKELSNRISEAFPISA